MKKALSSFRAIALDTGLTIDQVAFLAFRIVGCSQRAAYLAIRPEVTPESAEQQGCRLERQLSQHKATLDLESITDTLARWTVLRGMRPEVPIDVALRAADMQFKVNGTYNEPGVTINVLGGIRAPELREVEAVDVDVPEPPA